MTRPTCGVWPQRLRAGDVATAVPVSPYGTAYDAFVAVVDAEVAPNPLSITNNEDANHRNPLVRNGCTPV